ncbi:MAG: choice-of-anchor D domain-containing protein [Terriglobia bacterium]
MQTWPLRQRGVIPAIFLALMTTLAILLPPCTVALSAATATPSFVQAAASAAHGTPTTLSLAFPSSTRAGDLLLVAFDYDSSVTPASVTDSQRDVFTAVGNQLNSPGGALSRVYYAKNIKGGADTVTVTLSAESSYLELYLTEYSGINTTNPIDAEVGASGNAGTVSSGSVTTTAAGDIIYGYCVGDGVCSLGSGFTARSTLDANLMEDKTAGGAGSYAATGSATNGWTMQMVALKPASVVTPPVITSATTTTGTAAKALSYQITATGSPSSYGATGLPAGVSVNCGTGLISGTPTSAGTSTVTLSATNAGGTGKATLTVTIAAAVPPPAFVQAAASAAHGTPTTLSLAFPSSTRAGDLLLVAFDYDSSVTPASVTDSQGDVFTAVGNQLSTPGGALSRVYYAKNIKGGADTVTVTLSASSSYLELYLSEYSGINTSNPIDAEAGASGNAGAVSSGSVTTTAAGDIIYGYCVADWSCIVGSGFNARSTLDGNLMEDETAGGAGSYAATGTADGGWTMQMVALSPASASGSGQPPAPGISISPSSISFASQTVGASGSAQSVTLSNTGNAALSITGISITGADPSDFTETNNCGSSIAAGASCTISITFTPAASGSLSATLSVTASSVGDPSVGLTGTGTSTGGGTGGGSSPSLTLSSASLAFGSQPVDATSSAQTVTLSNTGSAALSITSLTITGTNAGNFAEIGNTCGSSVAAGGTCTVAVTFTPSAAGSSTAALSITDNATGSPQSVSLSGTGAHDVILSWTASTTPGVLGYDVYRGTTSGGESSTPLNSSPINGITFTDSNVTAGQAYYYVITTVNSNDAQSASSSETSVTVP